MTPVSYLAKAKFHRSASSRRVLRFVLAVTVVLVCSAVLRSRQLAARIAVYEAKGENGHQDANDQLTTSDLRSAAEDMVAPLMLSGSQLKDTANQVLETEYSENIVDNERHHSADPTTNDIERRETLVEEESSAVEKVEPVADHAILNATEPVVISTDPCVGRPQPAPIPDDHSGPPSLYFLHIPKTAGTLMYHLVIRYANKTNGLACQYTYDGNRMGPEHYRLSVNPPPPFPNGSIEQEAVDAINSANISRKAELLSQGGCRAMRGHVTYAQRDAMRSPIISLTVIRDPLERFISMYQFAMMMVKTRPGKTGWDDLLSGSPQEDFRNSSSLLNHGFYDKNGTWMAKGNIGFSFHLYGVLHQLSGIEPIFDGMGNPEEFRISNAEELAERAKDNICSTHILGSQSDMAGTLDLFFATLAPYANWTEQEVHAWKSTPVNKNVHKDNSTMTDWPEVMQSTMRRRFENEQDVYDFGMKVIAYRKEHPSTAIASAV